MGCCQPRGKVREKSPQSRLKRETHTNCGFYFDNGKSRKMRERDAKFAPKEKKLPKLEKRIVPLRAKFMEKGIDRSHQFMSRHKESGTRSDLESVKTEKTAAKKTSFMREPADRMKSRCPEKKPGETGKSSSRYRHGISHVG